MNTEILSCLSDRGQCPCSASEGASVTWSPCATSRTMSISSWSKEVKICTDGSVFIFIDCCRERVIKHHPKCLQKELSVFICEIVMAQLRNGTMLLSFTKFKSLRGTSCFIFRQEQEVHLVYGVIAGISYKMKGVSLSKMAVLLHCQCSIEVTKHYFISLLLRVSKISSIFHFNPQK